MIKVGKWIAKHKVLIVLIWLWCFWFRQYWESQQQELIIRDL